MEKFGPRCAALNAILIERERQDELKEAGKFPYTCADSELSLFDRLAILAEEYGEVVDEVSRPQTNYDYLAAELTQVAAVCLGWLEQLHRDHLSAALPAGPPTEPPADAAAAGVA